jgi:hypothetical protein
MTIVALDAHIMHIVLNDGRKITVTGFKDTMEMIVFSNAIDSDTFDFNNITLEPVKSDNE